MIKTYKDFNGPVYLELHDRRIFWEVESINVNEYELTMIIMSYVHQLQDSYKDLQVYCLGRSGRHVCIEDTPINRRRYYAVQRKANQLTDELVNTINNWIDIEEETV